MNFLSILNKEYLLPNSNKVRVVLSAGYGAIIVLILMLFSPFGFQNIETFTEKIIVATGYGLIAFTVWYLSLVLVNFTGVNKGKLWQILIFLAIGQFFSGFLSMIYNNVIFKNPSYFEFFLLFQIIVFLTGIIPFFYLVLFLETGYYNRIGSKKPAAPKTKTANKVNLITIRDQNPEKNLTLSADNIIYIQSQDNYIKIVWHTAKDEVKLNLLRATLGSAIKTLSGYDNIIQCHRSYIINLNFVKNVIGSTLSKKCTMRYSDSIIPVSRSKIKFVLEKLKQGN